MSEEDMLKNIDSLLFQCALQTRELSQKKNEINQQIQVYKAETSKAKSNIEKHKKEIERLDEDIKVKENTLTQNKAIAKSMKSTNSMLLHYEQTLKVELESRKAGYNHDREEYENRIASYRATFQSHKEYYYNNPLAQKLLGLQAENREIETRIKGYDDEIVSKQKELDSLTAPVVNISSPEKHSESISDLLSEEPEKQQEEPEEDTDQFPQHSQTKQAPTLSEEVNAEEIEDAHNTSTSSLPNEQVNTGGSQEINEEIHQEEAILEDADQEAVPRDKDLEQQFTVLEIEQAMEEEMDEGGAVEQDQATKKESSEHLTSLNQAFLQRTSCQSSPARPKADLTTPTFPFTFSPGSSPQIPDLQQSPAFSFNLHSEPSTPAFFGFGIAQEEDSASPFTSSFFGEKKTTESKTSMEFLFNQPVPSEDFQFSFNTKSPDKSRSNKNEGQGDEFPFSFNF